MFVHAAIAAEIRYLPCDTFFDCPRLRNVHAAPGTLDHLVYAVRLAVAAGCPSTGTLAPGRVRPGQRQEVFEQPLEEYIERYGKYYV